MRQAASKVSSFPERGGAREGAKESVPDAETRLCGHTRVEGIDHAGLTRQFVKLQHRYTGFRFDDFEKVRGLVRGFVFYEML